MTTHDPLAPLADVPPPRRTDDAFARSVQDGVRKRRSPFTFALPALAAAAAFAFFLVMRPGGEGPKVAIEAPDAVHTHVATVSPTVAIADPFDDDDALFALPMLEGSSDEELARLDRVLDQKLGAQRGER